VLAAFSLEIGQQPSFAMEILNFFRRRLQSKVVLRTAWGDALLHQLLDPFRSELLFRRQTKIQGLFALILTRTRRVEGRLV
jgi:hypothetical protein